MNKPTISNTTKESIKPTSTPEATRLLARAKRLRAEAELCELCATTRWDAYNPATALIAIPLFRKKVGL